MTALVFQTIIGHYSRVKETLINHPAPTNKEVKEFLLAREAYKSALKDVSLNGVDEEVEGGVEIH